MSGRVRYLLDTNVLSETRKKQADRNVLAFLAKADPLALFISILTMGELRKGAALKGRTDAEAAKRLEAWVEGLEASFADRILGIDAATAKLWGEWSAQRPRPVIDTLLAATAAAHGMVLVTRNLQDVYDLDAKTLDPWKEDGNGGRMP